MRLSRFAGLLAALAALVYLVTRPRFPRADAIAWFVVFGIAALAWCWAAGLMRTIKAARRPRTLLVPLLGLLGLSVVPISWCATTGLEAHAFLRNADSAVAIVDRSSGRHGEYLDVSYSAAGSTRHARNSTGSRALTSFQAGDTLWVYFPRTSPDSALLIRPEVPLGATSTYLLLIWIGLGPIACGHLTPLANGQADTA